MENIQEKSEKSKALVPVEQPEENNYELEEKYIVAHDCLMEDVYELQKIYFEHMSMGSDQIQLIRLLGLCLLRVEDSAPKEWLEKVKEKVSQISKLLHTHFDPETVLGVFKFLQKVETSVEEYGEKEGEDAAREMQYQLFKLRRDNHSFITEILNKAPPDFNKINQLIFELDEDLKGQDLQEIFGDALRVFENVFTKLQENAKTVEGNSIALAQKHENMQTNADIVYEGMSKIRKEKLGIEDCMTKLAITDGENTENKEQGEDKEKEKASTQLGLIFELALSQSLPMLEDSKEEVKAKEGNEEVKENEEKESLGESCKLA